MGIGALIGALRVSLSAETTAFEAGMKRAQRTTASATSGISKSLGLAKASLIGFAGALSIGMFTSAIKNALEYAGSLAEVANQLGVTAKDLQVFRFAAGQVGVSQEQLEVGLSKLTITLGKVASGAKEPAKALHAIGISVDELKGKDAGDAFRLIADGLQKIPDRAQRAAVEVALFGKTGSKLDNLLSGGSAAINELSLAAEKLGIVLSDEQIAKADETADKLEALKTVLSANIASAVADNADAILGLANALVALVSSIGSALNSWRQFEATINTGIDSFFGRDAQAARDRGSNFQSGRQPTIAGRSVTVKLGPAKPLRTATPTGNIEQFLASGGGAKKGRADHSAEQALRAANQFDQDIRRSQMDVLRATQELATDYSDRATISVQILDLEREGYKSQLDYEVASKDKTKAQAASLLALYDQKDALERQAIVADEQAQVAEDASRLNQVTFELDRNKLESEQQLAETASEQRDIQLRLLDLSYRQEKARLEAVLADEKASYAAKEEARRRLSGLSETFGNDRKAVIQGTRGPMEDYLASLPTTAAKANEALERLQVEGMDGFLDSILALSDGLDSGVESLLQTLKNFLLGLARLELQKGLGSLLQSSGGLGGIAKSIFGGGSSLGASLYPVSGGVDPLAALPGFASGGMGIFKGIPGVDRNVVSINGIPQFRVSHGERFDIGNDNSPRGGRGGLTQNFSFPNSDADSFRRNQSQTARVARRALRV